jgi:hypothetical protein
VTQPINQRRRQLLAIGAVALVGSQQILLSTNAYAQAGKETDLVSILDFQSFATSDWTLAVNQATAIARRVYFPAGEYSINGANWPPNTEIFGDGDSTILRMPPAANYIFNADSGSPLLQNQITGLYMHHVQLRASSDVEGFSEFKHLISLNGVSGARFEQVLFKGFRGDGLYLGSGNVAGMQRHNDNVTVDACRFDGINRENRNGVTVIDCDGLLVQNCQFANTTRNNMPGAIDIEPNKFPFHIARNITIRNNKFNNIGGNVGVISIYVPATVTAPPEHFIIDTNVSENYVGSGAFFHINDNRRADDAPIENDVQVTNNVARVGGAPFLILSGRKISFQGNTFEDLAQTARIGFPSSSSSVRNLQLIKNTFTRCGARSGNCISLFTADHVSFQSNKFIDSGSGSPLPSSAVAFLTGTSSYISFVDNEFSAPTGRTVFAIRKDVSHLFNPSTNQFSGNTLHGLKSLFETEQ